MYKGRRCTLSLIPPSIPTIDCCTSWYMSDISTWRLTAVAGAADRELMEE